MLCADRPAFAERVGPKQGSASLTDSRAPRRVPLDVHEAVLPGDRPGSSRAVSPVTLPDGPPRAGPLTSKLQREIVLLLAWSPAILLQLAHPLVPRGVADHGTFRTERYGWLRRLHGTVDAMLRLWSPCIVAEQEKLLAWGGRPAQTSLVSAAKALLWASPPEQGSPAYCTTTPTRSIVSPGAIQIPTRARGQDIIGANA